MAQLLIGLGHRHFGYIDGPEGHVSAAQRRNGVQRAMAEAGIPPRQLHVERGDFTFRSGIELSKKILAKPGKLTALVCANDDMAAGAMLTVHRMGWAIPADISISGFDDTPMSEIIWPPLTTVHQPIRQVGQRAIEMLVDAINSGAGAAEARFETVPFRIVERASAGQPRDRKAASSGA
jgi:LacI family transcriptional regulator